MKFISKISGLLVIGSICSTVILTMNFNAFAAEKTWQEAYLETVYSYGSYDTQYCDCQLIYLDDDDVPELYIGDPMSERYGGLYTYINGEAVCLMEFGFRDFFQAYSEKSGVFEEYYYIQNAGQEVGTRFYQLEAGSLILLDELTADVVNETYTINGETVDQEDYDSKITEYALTPEFKVYSYDEMILYLKEEINSQSTSPTDTTVTDNIEESSSTEPEETTETVLTTTVSAEEEITDGNATTAEKTQAAYTTATSKVSVAPTATSASPKTGERDIFALSMTGVAALFGVLMCRKKK